MQEVKLDFIIVGQGIAGTWLSHELIKRGYSVIVIDHSTPNTASKKAAGLYNPITGRKMVKTWKADELFPSIEDDYRSLESLLGSTFLYPTTIYRPFKNIEDVNDWEGKRADGQFQEYIKDVQSGTMGIENIHDPFGGILINHSGYVDLPGLIISYKQYLRDKGFYHEEMFSYEDMKITESQVQYKHFIASKVIFCEGPNQTNPYWSDLPFKLVRGEVIDIECHIDSKYVINQGVFMIPKEGYWTVGSTYDHSVLSFEPQNSGIENLKNRLGKIYSGNYRIKEKRAGVRPATHDRKPYIGFHKENGTISIFNGFGTKGVSLTPYFAKHFTDVLENKVKLDEEVDVQRVY